MPGNPDFSLVFAELKRILKPFAPFAARMVVRADTADTYYLDGPFSMKWKKVLFLARYSSKKTFHST